ncbi:MAG: hypothetical protein ACK553_03060 [Planctomycetota bacterium]
MPPSPAPANSPTPFGQVERGRRPTIGLPTILVSMVVFAVISLLLMFAARVPAVASSIDDLLGVRRGIAKDQPDRATHLFMLLFCYTSPLMLMIWMSLLKRLGRRQVSRRADKEPSPDPLA